MSYRHNFLVSFFSPDVNEEDTLKKKKYVCSFSFKEQIEVCITSFDTM